MGKEPSSEKLILEWFDGCSILSPPSTEGSEVSLVIFLSEALSLIP